MRSSINLTILFLIGIALYLPSEYCQELWEIIPEASENQEDLAGDILGEPIGFQPQSGMDSLPQSGMDSLPPPATAPPHIEFFNGPSEAKPGDIITLTWKVWDACSVYLDNNLKDAEGSYTYTVPMQGAPDTIYHQLMAYGKPCDNPVPMTKDLSIKIQRPTAPDAPTEFEFTGWTKTTHGPTANFKWKDNSNDEYGFKIYNGIDMVGSSGPDVTTFGIPLQGSCGKSLTFHVIAFNGIGGSAPSNSVSIEGLCPPKYVEIRNMPYDPSNVNYKYWVQPIYTGPWMQYDKIWVDVHVKAQSQSGEDLKEEVYKDVPLGSELEIKPYCFSDLAVYAIPKNAAGEGNPTDSIKLRRSKDDPECSYDPTQNLDYNSYQYQFSLGPDRGDSDEAYFYVYRPGPISAKATWEGTSDLNLCLEGPGNSKLNSAGPSPRVLSHVVTQEDLNNGSKWKISIGKHITFGSAKGTITLASPKGCCFAGAWDTNFGRMILKLLEDGQTITGNYDNDDGKIEGSIVGGKIEGNKLSGRWKESPTYSAPNDAGDLELYMSEDCESLIGHWKYGYTGDWDGDWEGTRVVGYAGLSPRGGGF